MISLHILFYRTGGFPFISNALKTEKETKAALPSLFLCIL
ncbi:hypothetical protein HMPREF6123_0009 [Oribacterium sinus F0268]|uniref:Uncharacterized protein n=1 Tax=Oribacterium sinus F0268 TaxID=585501 RepID=C2KU40_9FIRM|nr:hypothetical protein HMPREF6123_0009 [Oribacterium sinus F0268]